MPGTALMGGAVVGGIRSNSAVYYNPAALSYIDSNTISVSAASYQLEYATIRNGGGAGIDLLSEQFQVIPLISVSGIYKTHKLSRSTFGYMLFTKNQTSNSFSYRFDGFKDAGIFDNNPHILGSDNYYDPPHSQVAYIGDYTLQTSMNELCFGLGYSYKISDHLAVGITPVVAYRTQSYAQSFVAKAFPDTSSNLFNKYQGNNGVGINSVGLSDNENIYFYNIRTYVKLAVALDFGNLKLGCNLTTQSINFGGRSSIARDIFYSGGYADTNSSTGNVYSYAFSLNDRQRNIKTRLVSPMSASLGVDYTIANTNIAVTAEYFAPLAPYNAATPGSANFLRPSWQNSTGTKINWSPLNSQNTLELVESARAVTNFAISVKQRLDKKIFALVSFRTDYSSYKKVTNDFWEYRFVDSLHPAGQKLSFSDINLYHFNIGLIKKNRKSDMHLGVTYTYGTNKSFTPLANIAHPLDNTNVLGVIPDFSHNATYQYDSYSLVLSYTYHIK